MGAIKENNYTDKEFEIAHLFDAISHPARKRIVEKLTECAYCRNVDLSQYLNLSQTAVMNHLLKMKRAKLIEIHYDYHHYKVILDKKRLELITKFIEGVIEA